MFQKLESANIKSGLNTTLLNFFILPKGNDVLIFFNFTGFRTRRPYFEVTTTSDIIVTPTSNENKLNKNSKSQKKKNIFWNSINNIPGGKKFNESTVLVDVILQVENHSYSFSKSPYIWSRVILIYYNLSFVIFYN